MNLVLEHVCKSFLDSVKIFNDFQGAGGGKNRTTSGGRVGGAPRPPGLGRGDRGGTRGRRTDALPRGGDGRGPFRPRGPAAAAGRVGDPLRGPTVGEGGATEGESGPRLARIEGP